MLDKVGVRADALKNIISLNDDVSCEAMFNMLTGTDDRYILGQVETLKCITGEVTDDENNVLKITIEDPDGVEHDIIGSLREKLTAIRKRNPSHVIKEYTCEMEGMLKELELRLREVDRALKGDTTYMGLWLNIPYHPEATPCGMLQSCYTLDK
jgi:hypothetical protein